MTGIYKSEAGRQAIEGARLRLDSIRLVVEGMIER